MPFGTYYSSVELSDGGMPLLVGVGKKLCVVGSQKQFLASHYDLIKNFVNKGPNHILATFRRIPNYEYWEKYMCPEIMSKNYEITHTYEDELDNDNVDEFKKYTTGIVGERLTFSWVPKKTKLDPELFKNIMGNSDIVYRFDYSYDVIKDKQLLFDDLKKTSKEVAAYLPKSFKIELAGTTTNGTLVEDLIREVEKIVVSEKLEGPYLVKGTLTSAGQHIFGFNPSLGGIDWKSALDVSMTDYYRKNPFPPEEYLRGWQISEFIESIKIEPIGGHYSSILEDERGNSVKLRYYVVPYSMNNKLYIYVFDKPDPDIYPGLLIAWQIYHREYIISNGSVLTDRYVKTDSYDQLVEDIQAFIKEKIPSFLDQLKQIMKALLLSGLLKGCFNFDKSSTVPPTCFTIWALDIIPTKTGVKLLEINSQPVLQYDFADYIYKPIYEIIFEKLITAANAENIVSLDDEVVRSNVTDNVSEKLVVLEKYFRIKEVNNYFVKLFDRVAGLDMAAGDVANYLELNLENLLDRFTYFIGSKRAKLYGIDFEGLYEKKSMKDVHFFEAMVKARSFVKGDYKWELLSFIFGLRNINLFAYRKLIDRAGRSISIKFNEKVEILHSDLWSKLGVRGLRKAMMKLTGSPMMDDSDLTPKEISCIVLKNGEVVGDLGNAVETLLLKADLPNNGINILSLLDIPGAGNSEASGEDLGVFSYDKGLRESTNVDMGVINEIRGGINDVMFQYFVNGRQKFELMKLIYGMFSETFEGYNRKRGGVVKFVFKGGGFINLIYARLKKIVPVESLVGLEKYFKNVDLDFGVYILREKVGDIEIVHKGLREINSDLADNTNKRKIDAIVGKIRELNRNISDGERDIERLRVQIAASDNDFSVKSYQKTMLGKLERIGVQRESVGALRGALKPLIDQQTKKYKGDVFLLKYNIVVEEVRILTYLLLGRIRVAILSFFGMEYDYLGSETVRKILGHKFGKIGKVEDSCFYNVGVKAPMEYSYRSDIFRNRVGVAQPVSLLHKWTGRERQFESRGIDVKQDVNFHKIVFRGEL
ncbi:MAG: hypothetical protein Hyperionvirus3_125 [Hyperionvirus sp.]|uniref:Uncharacterized protein n=1 Tax=Hyperionvirus sp. TaxID=2487770 RepID=A0A3G5ACB2_9VIRU|nr:MAG: hypothetical protein Hyperionvirus3_125 [Hyperionvirus sp.]